ncbi:MAG: PD40 domain-containing protein [Burkholderiaceae bacterium]|nr:PD40 domain-containing protein [Burkholderiaceae bacterium]
MTKTLLALALLCASIGSAIAAPAQPLLFVSNRGGNAQIHVMNADGSGEHALTRGPAENTEPAWSPDGKRIVFTSYRDGNAEVYVMQADGSRATRLTVQDQADNAPAWLPDGRIVFRSLRSGWANFYAMQADGTGVTPLTTGDGDKGPPVPSPDGRWLAFVAFSERGGSEIHLMPATGGKPRDLTSSLSKGGKSFPSWSPDSRRLAYVEAKSPAMNVQVVNADGTQPAKLTDNAYTNAFPIWAPDGRRIAFVSSREGTRTEMARGDIYVMNADGSSVVNLTRHPDEDNYPAWAADGSAIYFVSLRDGNAQLYAVPLNGDAPARLTRNSGHDVGVRPLRLQPPTLTH